MNALKSARESLIETYLGLRWVWTEIVSPSSRRYLAIALGFLILTNLCLMSVPYAFKVVIDAHTVGDVGLRDRWFWHTLVLSVVAVFFNIAYDYFREHSWNTNFLSANLTVIRKLLARTIDELINQSSEIGVEHAESIKDRVQNILYLFMFDLSVVVVTILCATLLVFTIDLAAGLMVLSLTVFNLSWFFIFNAKLDEEMGPIDKQFRQATRRMVEKLTIAMSVKSGGVEHKIADQVEAEIKQPLREDLRIWAGWFLRVEFVRRLVNAVAPVVIIWFGVATANWSTGTISAMFFWIFMISREYGFIGHLMRHLSSQVSRLQAARKALEQEPAFRFDDGEPYVPKSKGGE